ncbi:hypothetical protein FRC07_009368 [Ceratobasidium sp. 392]|nr:hypothetical protein FRC07_009368 [Ceratobasidium sp. 392]
MPGRSAHKIPSPATLELGDIVVAIGNAAKEDDKHDTLTGYDYDGQKEDDEVVCWVPAVPGHRFCIRVGYDGDSIPYPDAGLRALVYIDGVGPVARAFVEPADILKRIEQRAKNKPVTSGEMEMTGQEIGKKYIRPFCFSKRETIEAENNIPPENLDYFGNISVEVYWAKVSSVKKESGTGEDSDDEDFAILAEPVNERLKHMQDRFAAGLGDQIIDDEPGNRDNIEVDGVNENEEFWFIFKYRDAEWLKSEGIVPASIN